MTVDAVFPKRRLDPIQTVLRVGVVDTRPKCLQIETLLVDRPICVEILIPRLEQTVCLVTMDVKAARPEVGISFPRFVATNQRIVGVLPGCVLTPRDVLDNRHHVVVDKQLPGVADILVDFVLGIRYEHLTPCETRCTTTASRSVNPPRSSMNQEPPIEPSSS